jgi:NIMA (never in mitosis gene a)-related kinase
MCLIVEYADDGDLFQRVSRAEKEQLPITEEEIWRVFLSVVWGLKALHAKQILHRDLKSANVFLFKDGTVKLGDLNVSKIAKKGLLYTQTGTPYYAAPEVWRDQPYDHKSDIWSLGCIVYEMATYKTPFRAPDMRALYNKVLKGWYEKLPLVYSNDLQYLVRGLLQVSPTFRPSCEKILEMKIVINHLKPPPVETMQAQLEVDLLETIRLPDTIQ